MSLDKNIKKRHWAMILYPESAPLNWKEILQETGLQCAISPLHDMDKDDKGNFKKEHYHIILSYSNNTTFNVVSSLCDKLNQPIPQAIENVKGYFRYLTHEDDSDKFHYDKNYIVGINGFPIHKYTDSNDDINVVIELVMLTDFITDNNITEYHTFIEMVKNNDSLSQYLHTAMKKTIFLNAYIRSLKYKLKSKLD